MPRFARLALALTAVGLSLAACDRFERPLDDRDKARMVAYLADHPDVIQAAISAYQLKAETRAVARSQMAIGPNRAALEHDPADFVANPQGRITVTEFYDYRCPHCVNAAPTVVKIIKDNPDVRFVFKEFPIFGAASETAAAAAIAVKRGGGDYLRAYAEMMAARPLTAETINQVLAEQKISSAALAAPGFVQAVNDQLTRTHNLAQALGLQGTPAFVVGDTMIPGEDMDAVRAAIKAQRARKG